MLIFTLRSQKILTLCFDRILLADFDSRELLFTSISGCNIARRIIITRGFFFSSNASKQFVTAVNLTRIKQKYGILKPILFSKYIKKPFLPTWYKENVFCSKIQFHDMAFLDRKRKQKQKLIYARKFSRQNTKCTLETGVHF